MDWIRTNLRLLLMIVVAAALAFFVISKHMPKGHARPPQAKQQKSPLAGKTPASWTGQTRILGAVVYDCAKQHLSASRCRTLPQALQAQLLDHNGRVVAHGRVDRTHQFTLQAKLAVGDYTATVSGASLSAKTPVHVAVVPKTLPVLVVFGR